MNLNKSLEELGLTQNEITIFVYLLSSGIKTGNDIYKDNGLDKSSAYKAISQLLRRDLVITSGSQRNQKFQAVETEKVLKLFDEKKEEVEQSKNHFKNIIKDIEKYSADKYHNDNIKVFTGDNAYELYHKELLTGDVKLIRTISDSQKDHEFAGSQKLYGDMNSWFIPERVSKGIKIRVLFDKNSNPDETSKTNPKLLKEARKYNDELKLDSIMSTFGDRVGFSTTKNGNFWGIVIKDQLIVNLLNSLYDAIWSKSEIY